MRGKYVSANKYLQKYRATDWQSYRIRQNDCNAVYLAPICFENLQLSQQDKSATIDVRSQRLISEYTDQ